MTTDLRMPLSAGRVARGFVLAAAVLSLGGCVTLSKFHALKERVESLEREKELLTERIERDEARMENLHVRVKDYEGEMRREGADRGASLDDLRTELQRVNGKLEELAFHGEARRQQLRSIMDFVDARFGVSFAVDAAGLPPDKDALFQLGTERMTQGKTSEARTILRTYRQRYEGDDRSDDALLLIAESYMTEGKPDLAVREFQALHDQFPKSELVAKALWRISDALVAQKECKKAIAVLRYLKDTQRRTSEAEKVPDRVRELKGACAD